MSDKDHGLTRREFLKGAGLTAAGAALASGAMVAIGAASVVAQEAGGGAPKPAVLGPGPVKITLNVNGADRKLEVEPRTTLAEALRLDLDLTGTKVVCDRGSCSACTVMLMGRPVCACMTLAIDAADAPITTIEGLAKGDQLHPVQACFVKHDATQCGFCTPGMVMSCAALLERNTAPTLDDVRAATSGNLCRCGTYPKVFAATLEAATLTAAKGGK